MTGNTSESGAGLYNNSGTVIATNSLFDGNTAVTDGGGIYSAGATADLTVINVTLSSNSAGDQGGGLYNAKDTELRSVTITSNTSVNQGGGVYESGASAITSVQNSIIASNTSTGTTSEDVNGSFTSLDNNLIGNTTGGTGWGVSDMQNVNPLMNALADNGGPLLTHSLQTGSPAINGGSATNAPMIDQRGYRRTDGSIDIGAFEVGATTGITAPTLTITGTGAVARGGSYTLNLSATDPEGVTITSWTINWGDGNIETIAGNPSTATHVYNDNLAGFTFDITVSVIDADGTWHQNDLLVSQNGSFYRFTTTTGQFVEEIGAAQGMGFVVKAIQGPDGNLYVTSATNFAVYRYAPDGTFIDQFVAAGSGGLSWPSDLLFGPDGNLYVASGASDEILRYDGTTGTFLGEFVTANSGGLDEPNGMSFGADGNFYVASSQNSSVLVFDGNTGAFLTTFVGSGSGGLNYPEDLAFGPDGNLYVTSRTNHNVLRFNGATGAFIDEFVTSGSGGLNTATGIAFGPDGHLYVSSEGTDQVLRFDGTTGAFLDVTVAAGTSGIDMPMYLHFLANHQVTVAPNTLTVSTTADVSDGDTSSISALIGNKGADGAISLREALLAANNTPNGPTPDVIDFDILAPLVAGSHTISLLSLLPQITDSVILDATTDSDFANTPVIILDGNNLNTEGLHLTNTADGSTIRGLVIRDFGQNAIYIDAGSDNNTIVGNYLGSLTVAGTDAGDAEENTGYGIYIDGAHNTIGGTSVADRNVISGNGGGIAISGVDAHHNQILGNFIGTNAAGTALIGNGNLGIVMASGATDNQIGSSTAGAANVIGGNLGGGIALWDFNTSDNAIQGNYIGTDLTATVNLANWQEGIEIAYGASGNLIGGTGIGQGNVITNNGNVLWAGVTVEETSSNNAILGNRIYSNAGPGIHLGWASNVPEPNDIGDFDSGANELQNYPVLSIANSTNGNTAIVGAINTTADVTYRIEFFSSATGDVSGYGEGQTYLGSTTVTTDTSGNANFSIVLNGVTVIAGQKVTATATVDLGAGNFGSTSEFAANVTATANPAGVTVTPTTGLTTTEAGGTATFNISLNSAPTNNVTITLTSSDPTEGSPSTTTLFFDASNWSTPQTVTVTGLDDQADEGNVAYTIITVATSSDAAYNNITVSDVSLTNTDNDTINSLAYESFNYATGSLDTRNGGTGWSGGWATAGSPAPMASTVAGSILDPSANLVHRIDNSATTTVTASGVAEYRNLSTTLGSNSSTRWMSFLMRPNGLITTDAYAGMGLGGTANFGDGGLFIGALDSGQYGIELTGGGLTVTAANSVVTPGTPVLLVMKMEFMAGNDTFTLYVNPTPGRDTPDSTVGMTAVHSGLLDLGNFTRVIIQSGDSLTGTFDEIRFGNTFAEVTPGLIHVTPASVMTTSEAGATDKFYVELTQAPTSNVLIGISSSDTTEGTVSTSSLTFTTTNWATAQAVTLSGINDALVDGNISYRGVTTAATSIDTLFNGANAPDALALNLDSNQPPSDLERRNLVINGSFEDPDVAIYDVFTSITGWTGAGDRVEIVDNAAIPITNVASDGTQLLELDADDGNATTGVYQDINTVPGRSYTLELDVAARGGTALSTNTVEVWWRGTQIGTIDPPSTAWATYTFTVTGSGGSDRLEFKHPAVDDDSLGGLIDRVSLVENFRVAEQSANGTSVGVVVGIEPNTTDTLTYSITDSAGGRFAINGTTGEVTVANGELLDYEQAALHNITVRVTDQAGLYYDEVFAITVTNVSNENPTLIVPGAQTMNEDGTLIFSSGNGNVIRINSDAGNSLNVTLTATNGTLSLAGTTGLSFTSGDGTTDATMTFSGTVENINSAMSGLNFQPTAEFSGSGSVSISTTDGTYASLNVSANQKGRYTFDNTGALGTDDSGSGNTGTVVGATAFNDPTRGQVLSLDGNDYVQIAGLYGQPANVTLAAWVNLTAADTSGSNVITLGNNIVLRMDEPGKGVDVVWHNGSGFTTISTNTYLAGTGWHHVAATFDDTSNLVYVYIDGNIVVAAATIQSISYTQNPDSFIGKASSASTAYDFTGKLDDVRVYNRALTATEIKTLALSAPSDSAVVAVTVNAVNDAPTITTNTLSITEGAAVVLGSVNINSIDSDNTPSQLTYTTSSITGGQFELVASPGTAITSFTQAQINAGAVRFVHNGGESAPNYAITVSDGAISNGPSTVTIGTFTRVNDAPTISTNTLSITEGATTVLSNANINTTDPDNTSAQLNYTASNISGGQFELVASPGAAITTFTQAQINSGAVQFVHNGGEAAPSYALTMSDGSLSNGPSTVSVGTFGGVNDAPTITTNSLSINEGATVVLSNANINATDPDSTPAQLTYTASSISGGQFELVTAPGIAVTTFTQAQINSSAVRFVHNGGESAPSYQLTISDGSLTNGPLPVTIGTFTNVNDNSPSIVSNGGGTTASINVAENSTTVTTVAATDTDLPGQTLTYTITGGADASKFVIGDSTGELAFISASNFESPIDAGGNNVYDVQVTVSDGTLTDVQDIAVTVTAVNDNYPAITSNGSGPTATINVAENTTTVTTVIATDADLPSQTLTYSITGGADAAKFSIVGSTGVLTFALAPDFDQPGDASGNNVYDVQVTASDGMLTDVQDIAVTVTDNNEAPTVSAISNQTINEDGTTGLIAFTVSDPETASGTLSVTAASSNTAIIPNGNLILGGSGANRTITVSPAADQNGGPIMITITVSDGTNATQTTFTVTINAVNDAPIIATNALSITEGATVVLSNANINTTDPDNIPSQLTYTASSISGGQFELVATPGVAVTTFTQQQINNGDERPARGRTADVYPE